MKQNYITFLKQKKDYLEILKKNTDNEELKRCYNFQIENINKSLLSALNSYRSHNKITEEENQPQ